MPAKIRLARHGRKRYAYYHIVVADSRAPRDGRYIERIGSFNPNNDPATIELDFERALHWVMTGAQPTETVRSILSDEGVMMKKHLLGGVSKGAFDEQEAERRFEAWVTAKKQGTEAYSQTLQEKADAERKERLEHEAKINSERSEALAAVKAELEAEANAAVKAAEEAAAAELEAAKAAAAAKEAEATAAKEAKEAAAAAEVATEEATPEATEEKTEE